MARYGAPQSSPECVLACHGTITRRLGIDTAIKAVSLLVDRIATVRLRVLGGGDYLEEARRLASRLGVADRVHFEGVAPIGNAQPRRQADRKSTRLNSSHT